LSGALNAFEELFCRQPDVLAIVRSKVGEMSRPV